MGQKVKQVRIAELEQDKANANKGSERGAYMLENSFRQYGAGRSILIDKFGRIIAGNKSAEQAAALGMDDVIVVESDGTKLIAVQRTDLDLYADDKARKLAYADNRTSDFITWDPAQLLADLNAGVDLSDLWRQDELDELLGSLEAAAESNDTEPEDAVFTGVPDAVWPTDNDLGIPLLDPNMQATAIDQPTAIWGNTARRATMRGTWLFYTGDDRFEALWQDPSAVLMTQAVSAVEPNFSVYRNMPPAVAIWQIYRKRWIARWWQSMGLRVVVDLNVANNYYELNRLGVPQGWKSFCTRGYSERIDEIHLEYGQACAIAGEGVTPLFVVYGGGQAVKQEAMKRGWLWIPEVMDVRGKRRIVEG